MEQLNQFIIWYEGNIIQNGDFLMFSVFRSR